MGFLRRQSVVPFETGFAAFCVTSGVAGLLKWGMVSEIFIRILGWPLSSIFNTAFAIAGVALFVGIGLNRRNLELFGLVIIIMSLLVRSLVVFNVAHLDRFIITAYAYAGIFIVSCLVRIYDLTRNRTLVQTAEAPVPHLTNVQ